MLAKRFVIMMVLTVAVVLLGAAPPAESAAPKQAPPHPMPEETPPARLAYDAALDLPHLPSDTVIETGSSALLAPEYANWSRLVFQSARNERDWEVYGARGDGSDQVNLSMHSSMDTYPRLNRGATRVVFVSNRKGNNDIYAMNADGRGQIQLTSDATSDVNPAWSPDGSRIAFQSYRDGQAEIYTMNADGTGKKRVTNYKDYDGQPNWSPDGTQIAYIRRADGKNRVWVMSADGSLPRQLSNQTNSELPIWSPDGSQIAYDADGNGDGWQELWLMDAAGGSQRMVFQPGESNTDAWARSWSPDGRYIAFTRITWIYYQGEWYWATAYLDGWDTVNPGNIIRLSSNGNDLHPDWQSADLQAPASGMTVLPAQSPAAFNVNWSGTDIGPAGIASFDVQVKDGAAGAWTGWLLATSNRSASFTGIGGHTYYFRVRARDFAGNAEAWPADYQAVTTVESLPPITVIQPLPAFTRGEYVFLLWSGSDPGGSGIQSYDVQVRQNDGAWNDWVTDSSATSALFRGTVGTKCDFRVRGKDTAQNMEPWPVSGADASTTLYAWAVAGTVTDNRGAPVVSMTVTTEPGAYQATPSNDAGFYSAYVTAQADNYSVTWSKDAYGALPGTAFSASQDTETDVVLPPADNVVQNWGFESGSDAWQLGGNLTAVVTNTLQHSGATAAFLGSTAGPLGFVTSLPDPPEQGRYPLAASALDAEGAIHVVWIGPGLHIMYSKKPPAGPWTIPEPIPGPLTLWGPLPGLHVDSAGTVHVAWWSWINSVGLNYSQKQAGAGWSTPEVVPTTPGYNVERPGLGTTATGVLKVVWDGPHFSQRDADGKWSSPQDISGAHFCNDCDIKMLTGSTGLAHVMWRQRGGGGVFYTAETSSGTWLPAEKLSQAGASIENAEMVIDARDTVHVIWGADGVYYRMRPAGGTWSSQDRIASAVRAMASIAADQRGVVHVVWGDWLSWDSGIVFYATGTNHSWTAPVEITPPTVSSLIQWEWAPPKIAIDDYRTVHILWLDTHRHDSSAFYGVRYATRDGLGRWSFPADIYHHAGGEPFRDTQLLVTRSGAPHVLWSAPINGNTWPVWYAGAEVVQTAGEAILSQPIQVPEAAHAPTLSFWHRFATGFPSDSRLELVVDDGIAASVVLSETTSANTWKHRWVDLTPWAGRGGNLRFRVVEADGGGHAWAYIDEVSVGSAHPDTWVRITGQRAALPGGQLVQELIYGNRGSVAAAVAQITLQLPPELTLVSADPPPAATMPALRWDIGNLAAQSRPQMIRLVLQVAPSASNGARMIEAASISSDTAEIEQVNNVAQTTAVVGHLTYLPVLERR
jgi:Tol biopolymer transport system component